MVPIYDEMRTRNLSNIVSPGHPQFNVDRRICEATQGTDDRRCLSLYTFPKVTLSSDGLNLVNALTSSFGADSDMVVFSPSPPSDGNEEGTVWGKLHWTLMQLQGFNDWKGDARTPEEKEEFGRTVESYFAHDKRIKIRMTGVIAVKTGLLIVGIPNANINDTRDQVRAKMSESPPLYPLKEPFLNDIVHSTILRVCGGDGKGPKMEEILRIAEEFKDIYLGDAYVDELNVGEASWRMMDDELSRTPPMWSWKLQGEVEDDMDNAENADDSINLNKASVCSSDTASTVATSTMGSPLLDDDSSVSSACFPGVGQFTLEDVGWKGGF